MTKYINVFVIRDKFYIPTLYEAMAGFSVSGLPVCKGFLSDIEHFHACLMSKVLAGNKAIPTPDFKNSPKVPDFVLESGFRTLKIFEKESILFEISIKSNELVILKPKKRQKGGWENYEDYEFKCQYDREVDIPIIVANEILGNLSKLNSYYK